MPVGTASSPDVGAQKSAPVVSDGFAEEAKDVVGLAEFVSARFPFVQPPSTLQLAVRSVESPQKLELLGLACSRGFGYGG
jgi:hypothetical protein